MLVWNYLELLMDILFGPCLSKSSIGLGDKWPFVILCASLHWSHSIDLSEFRAVLGPLETLGHLVHWGTLPFPAGY